MKAEFVIHMYYSLIYNTQGLVELLHKLELTLIAMYGMMNVSTIYLTDKIRKEKVSVIEESKQNTINISNLLTV
jgi:hypothetical protein